jgi:hypothetical protein
MQAYPAGGVTAAVRALAAPLRMRAMVASSVGLRFVVMYLQ